MQRLFTPLICDLEPDITKPTSRKIFVSYDLSPDTSSGLDSEGVIDQGFRGPFIINSSCHDFDKLTNYKKEQSTVATYVGIYKIYIIHISIYLFFCFTEKVRGTKTEQSDVATYGSISKLYIIQIRIYLFFCFTEKVLGTKAEQSDVATYGGRIHVYIFYGYGLSSQLCLCMEGYLNYISSRYAFITCFVSLTKCAGRKLNNLMWDRVSVKRGYVWRDKSSISSPVMYLAYVMSY